MPQRKRAYHSDSAADDDDEPPPKRATPPPPRVDVTPVGPSTPPRCLPGSPDSSPRGIGEALAPFRFGQKTFRAAPLKEAATVSSFQEQRCGLVPFQVQGQLRTTLCSGMNDRSLPIIQSNSPFTLAVAPVGTKQMVDLTEFPTTKDDLRANPTDVSGEMAPNMNNERATAAWNTAFRVMRRLRLDDRQDRQRLAITNEHPEAVATKVPGTCMALDHSSTAQPVPADLSAIWDQLHRASDASVETRVPRVGMMDADELLARVMEANLHIDLSAETFRNVMTVPVTPADAQELLCAQYGAYEQCVWGEACIMLAYARHLEAADWQPSGVARPPCKPGMAFLCANDRRIVENATRNGTRIARRSSYPLMCLMCLRYQQAKDIQVSMAGKNTNAQGAPLNTRARPRTDNITRDVGYPASECFQQPICLAHGMLGPIRFFNLGDFVPYVKFVTVSPFYGGSGEPEAVLCLAESSGVLFDKAAMSVPSTRVMARPTWASLREGVCRAPLTHDALLAAGPSLPMDTVDVSQFLTRSLRAVARDLRGWLLREAATAGGDHVVPEGLLPVRQSLIWQQAETPASGKKPFDGPTGQDKRRVRFDNETLPDEPEQAEANSDHDPDADAYPERGHQTFTHAPTIPLQDILVVQDLEMNPAMRMPILTSDIITLDTEKDPPMEPSVHICRFHMDKAVRQYAAPWVATRLSVFLKILSPVATTLHGAAGYCMFIMAIIQAKYGEHIFRKGTTSTEDMRLVFYNYMLAKRTALAWFIERAYYGHPIDDVSILRDLHRPDFGTGNGLPGGVYHALLPTRQQHVPRVILRIIQETYPRTWVFCQRQGTRALLVDKRVTDEDTARLMTAVPFTELIHAASTDRRVWDTLVGICLRYETHLRPIYARCADACTIRVTLPPERLWTWERLSRADRVFALVVLARLAILDEVLANVSTACIVSMANNPLVAAGMYSERLLTSDQEAMRALAARRMRYSHAGCVQRLMVLVRECAQGIASPAVEPLDGDSPLIPSDETLWCGDLPNLQQVFHACGFLSNDSSQFATPKPTRGTGIATMRINRKKKTVDTILRPTLDSMAQANGPDEVWDANAALADARAKRAAEQLAKRAKQMQDRAISRHRKQIERATGVKFPRVSRRPAARAKAATTVPDDETGESPKKPNARGGGPRRRNYPSVYTSNVLLGDAAVTTPEPPSYQGFATWFAGDKLTMRGIVRLASALLPREARISGDQANGSRERLEQLVQVVSDLATCTNDPILFTFMSTAIIVGLGGLYPWSISAVNISEWIVLQHHFQGTDAKPRLAKWVAEHPYTAIVCFRQAFIFGLSSAPSITAALMVAGRPEIHEFARSVVESGNLVAVEGKTWRQTEAIMRRRIFETLTDEIVLRPVGISAVACVRYVAARARAIRGNSSKAAATTLANLIRKKNKFTATSGAPRRRKGGVSAEDLEGAMAELDALIREAVTILHQDPSRAIDMHEYAASTEWLLTQILISGTRPGVLPGVELIELLASFGGGQPVRADGRAWPCADGSLIRPAYEALIRACARAAPIDGPDSVIALINSLPTHLWRSMYGFMRAFIAWADLQTTWLGDSAIVGAQRLVRVSTCLDHTASKEARSTTDAPVSFASCYPQLHAEASVAPAAQRSRLAPRVVVYTVCSFCYKMASPFMGVGNLKSNPSACGTKEITRDATTGINHCRAGSRNRRRKNARENSQRQRMENTAQAAAGRLRKVAVSKRNIAAMSDCIVATHMREVEEATANMNSDPFDDSHIDALNSANERLTMSQANAKLAHNLAEAAELEAAEAMASKPGGVTSVTATGAGTSGDAAPVDLGCKDFFATDMIIFGAAAIYGGMYHRPKEARRGGEIIVATTCCMRCASVEVLDGWSLTCPACLLPLKRRGPHGTGAVSTSAATVATASAVAASYILSTSTGVGMYGPWRDFTDRMCLRCDRAADRSVPLTVFSRGSNDDGLYTFVTGFLCPSHAGTVSLELNRDSCSGTLQNTILSRDWLEMLNLHETSKLLQRIKGLTARH